MTWSCNNEKLGKTWLSPTHVCLKATEECNGHETNGDGVSNETTEWCCTDLPCCLLNITILTRK